MSEQSSPEGSLLAVFRNCHKKQKCSSLCVLRNHLYLLKKMLPMHFFFWCWLQAVADESKHSNQHRH